MKPAVIATFTLIVLATLAVAFLWACDPEPTTTLMPPGLPPIDYEAVTPVVLETPAVPTATLGVQTPNSYTGHPEHTPTPRRWGGGPTFTPTSWPPDPTRISTPRRRANGPTFTPTPWRPPPPTHTPPPPGAPPTIAPVPTILPLRFTPTPGGQYDARTGQEWYEAGLDYADTVTDVALRPFCGILKRLRQNLDEGIREEYYRGDFQGLLDRLKEVFEYESEHMDKGSAARAMDATGLFHEYVLFAGPPMQDYPDTWTDVDWYGLKLGLQDGYIRFCDRWEKGTPTPTPTPTITPTPSYGS